MPYNPNPYYISPTESDNESEIIEVSEEEDSIESSEESLESEIDEFSLNDDEIDICDEICQEEYNYFEEDRIHKKYYLGTCAIVRGNYDYMLSSSISPYNFYRYRMIDVLHYLWAYSAIRSSRSRFEIMQLHIDPIYGFYNIIIKTFWLRIVQRTWKRIYKERKEIWRKRMSILALRYRETTGKFPDNIRSLPSIVGMI